MPPINRTLSIRDVHPGSYTLRMNREYSAYNMSRKEMNDITNPETVATFNGKFEKEVIPSNAKLIIRLQV